MRKWVKITIPIVLLVVGAVICALRWQAWFGIPTEPAWNNDTLRYVFPTFAQDSVPGFEVTPQGWKDNKAPESLDLLVLGDVHNRLDCTDYNHLAAAVPQADAVLQVGDWMDRGQEYYHQLLLREWLPSQLCGLPVINCPGNHEYTKGVNKTLSPVWSETFQQPDNGPIGVPGKHYYIDFPNLRLIAIDTNPLTRIMYLTRTLTWLREAMYTAGDRYVVVIMHHPALSVAKGRVNPQIYSIFRHALGDADLVIAGHDHSYMRRRQFVVINAAGKPKQQRIHYPTDAIANDPVYGILQCNGLTGAACLTFNVYRLSDNTLIDSYHVTHD